MYSVVSVVSWATLFSCIVLTLLWPYEHECNSICSFCMLSFIVMLLRVFFLSFCSQKTVIIGNIFVYACVDMFVFQKTDYKPAFHTLCFLFSNQFQMAQLMKRKEEWVDASRNVRVRCLICAASQQPPNGYSISTYYKHHGRCVASSNELPAAAPAYAECPASAVTAPGAVLTSASVVSPPSVGGTSCAVGTSASAVSPPIAVAAACAAFTSASAVSTPSDRHIQPQQPQSPIHVLSTPLSPRPSQPQSTLHPSGQLLSSSHIGMPSSPVGVETSPGPQHDIVYNGGQLVLSVQVVGPSVDDCALPPSAEDGDDPDVPAVVSDDYDSLDGFGNSDVDVSEWSDDGVGVIGESINKSVCCTLHNNIDLS